MTKTNEGITSGLNRNWNSSCVQIQSGSSLSGSVLLAGKSLLGFVMPDVWSPQASLGIDCSVCPNGQFFALTEDNVEIVLTVAASTFVTGSPLHLLRGAFGMRFRSGSAVGDPDDQSAARTFAIFHQG